MAKKNFCPRCGSNKMKWKDPQMGLWECRKCGYRGSVVVEDGNIEKNIKESRKMDKLSKKLSWKR
jgi:ribosomal protein L37AE/L43A